MSKDLFDEEEDLFGSESDKIEDLFPDFNPPTQKEEINEANKESEVQQG